MPIAAHTTRSTISMYDLGVTLLRDNHETASSRRLRAAAALLTDAEEVRRQDGRPRRPGDRRPVSAFECRRRRWRDGWRPDRQTGVASVSQRDRLMEKESTEQFKRSRSRSHTGLFYLLICSITRFMNQVPGCSYPGTQTQTSTFK